MKQLSAKQLVLIALFAATVTVATMFSRISFSPNGYFNLGETLIYATAFTFGPLVGGIAGGLGAALADIFSGFLLPWAPITFVLKGIEGYVVGKLGSGKEIGGKITAAIIGGLVIIIGYPLASVIFYGWGAFLPELYVDLVQVSVGIIVAIPLSKILKNIAKEMI